MCYWKFKVKLVEKEKQYNEAVGMNGQLESSLRTFHSELRFQQCEAYLSKLHANTVK
jgi:hypothetical protein